MCCGPVWWIAFETSDPTSAQATQVFPSAQVRDHLGVSASTIRTMHEAMLGDTEDADGTGTKAAVPGLRICAKTGTAQVQDERNVKTGLTTWFASFAPYEKPRYAVVVMVENGESGGTTCAPVAHDIYAAILRPGTRWQSGTRWQRPIETMFDADLNERQSRIDRVLVVALVGLMLLGAAFVYSATMVSESARLAPWYNQSWFRQIVWYLLGTGVAAAICCVDYHTLARWSMVAYWVAVLMLVVVLLFGSVRFGARRWFDLGFFSLQPSEFAKLAFILAQAHFLSRPVEELRALLTFWKALGLMLLPFVLILKEPDLGSALVLLPTGLAMLFVAGTPRRYLLRLLAGVGILGALFLVDVLLMPPNWQIKLEDYQRRRLMVYFGIRETPRPGASKAERARLRQAAV